MQHASNSAVASQLARLAPAASTLPRQQVSSSTIQKQRSLHDQQCRAALLSKESIQVMHALGLLS